MGTSMVQVFRDWIENSCFSAFQDHNIDVVLILDLTVSSDRQVLKSVLRQQDNNLVLKSEEI